MPIVAEDVIPSMFLPELVALREAIFGRVLPTFDQLESEADQIESEAHERFDELGLGENHDPGDLAEAAFNAGLEHFEIMTATRQTVIIAFTITLSHLFEQQRHLLSFNTLIESESNSRKREERFLALLRERGIDCASFVHDTKLKELDLAANVAKHAEGQSADRLREIRPELFIHPGLRDDTTLGGPSSRPTHRPLMGEDLFVQADDLRAYLDAVESFWKFVLDRLSPAT